MPATTGTIVQKVKSKDDAIDTSNVILKHSSFRHDQYELSHFKVEVDRVHTVALGNIFVFYCILTAFIGLSIYNKLFAVAPLPTTE
jgi:hypothetical protein